MVMKLAAALVLVLLFALAFVHRRWNTVGGQVVFFIISWLGIGFNIALISELWDDARPSLLALLLAGVLTYAREVYFRGNTVDAMKARGNVRGLARALRQQPVGREEIFRREEAAAALGEIRTPLSVEALVGALGDEDSRVATAAEKSLLQIGRAAVDALIVTLKTGNSGAREQAARVLGRSRDVRAMEPLIASLNDDVEDVCREAAIGLEKIGDGRAIRPLLRHAPEKLMARHVLKSLMAITRRHATKLDKATLREILSVPDKVVESEEIIRFIEGEISGIYAAISIHFGPLKDLARNELSRRGPEPDA
jgi:hypothetical protein